MSLGARSSSKERDMPEINTHMARLVGITDLGHQPSWEWNGKVIPSEWKFEFTYELVNSVMKDGRPHWVSEEIKNNDFEGKGITSTLMYRIRTLDKTNATKDGSDLTQMLGRPCMVTLTSDKKGYPKIKGQAAVGSIPAGMEVPPLVNDTFVFSMDEPDMDVWNDRLSDFTKEKIQRAINYPDSAIARVLAEEMVY